MLCSGPSSWSWQDSNVFIALCTTVTMLRAMLLRMSRTLEEREEGTCTLGREDERREERRREGGERVRVIRA